jgi:DNA-binding NarL/FixJ family response regulator
VLNILIVDDDPGFRLAARELLERAGLAVVGEAQDGAGARDELRARRPDGVLLDVNLPDASGPALAEELLAIAPGTRIVLTSSDGPPPPGGIRGMRFVSKLELADCDLVSCFSS